MSAERSAIVLGSTSSETAYLVSRMKPRVGILAICQSIDACLAKASDMGVPRAIFVESGHDIGGLAEALRSSRIRTTLIAFGRTGTQGGGAAIEAGAAEFIAIPVDDAILDELMKLIWPDAVQFLFADDRMRRVMALVKRVAPSDVPLLVLGETGTGKEVLARQVHMLSSRRNGPFISINCAAIPDQLLESELFGHEKGAFTGAVTRRIGKFEEANGGTLLLDEIGEMELRLQAKLLRALQERQVDRVGATRPVGIDIRVIATTNRDLEREVKAGRFREDLFYRLNVINIVLPPLRERKGDIAVLSDYFLEKYSRSTPLGRCRLTEGALAKLAAYDWPGNVRELENTVYRAALLTPSPDIPPEAMALTDEQSEFYDEFFQLGPVLSDPAPVSEQATSASADPAVRKEAQLSQPPVSSREATGGPTHGSTEGDRIAGIASFVGQTIALVEQELIVATLERCFGNRTQAAHVLGISIQTLRNKLDRYRASCATAA